MYKTIRKEYPYEIRFYQFYSGHFFLRRSHRYRGGLGYECVEVACWPKEKAARRYAGITHIDIEALTDEKIASIHETCLKKNVAISALAYYPNTLTDDLPSARKR